MRDAHLKLITTPEADGEDVPRKSLGRHLVDSGVLSSDHLVKALDQQRTVPARLGEILKAEGWAGDADLSAAISQQHGYTYINLAEHPPDPSLITLRPPRFWMKYRALPWVRLDDALVVVTAYPEEAEAVRAALGPAVSVMSVLADSAQITSHLTRLLRPRLAAASLTRVDPDFSCRSWRAARHWQRVPLALALAAGGMFLVDPPGVIAGLSLLAMVTLALIAGLKTTGLISFLLTPRDQRHRLGDLGVTAQAPGRSPYLWTVCIGPKCRCWCRFTTKTPLPNI